jgi:hypothetical protein
MAQPHNRNHHVDELQLITRITKWQEHIIVLKRDVLTLEDILSSFSKVNDDVATKLQRILDQIRDQKGLLAGVDGEFLQLRRSMDTLNLKI